MGKNAMMDNDSWLNVGLSHLFDILLLGIITTALCIPVVTAGPAITANFDVMFRISLKKESSVFKQYFIAFKKNFLKSLVIWLIMLVLGAFIIFSAVVSLGGFVSMDQPVRIGMIIVSIILALIYGFEITYVFALQARYENKIMTTILNALLVSIGNFPKSFGMLLMTGVLVALGCFIWGLIPLFFILEFSFVTFFSSKILLSIFAKMGDDEAAGKDQTAQSEEE
ncbi:MAG: YesL family protein [Lachnospiraceae bacterium]|nr:YesL family protein [Lachnospiraceae bacterium]